MKRIINTFHKYMNSETVVPIEVIDIPEITACRCAVGKHGKGWYVWEVTTGMAVVQFAKTKKDAIRDATTLIDKNAAHINEVVAHYPVRNA